ncbi:hypothetical protein [Psychroserpens sp. Hel_I_66]|uniref:hypothetical protein n=1 Tax=Psychroserpens sp. Hel_I_66 TaxID=1250004 RepID=UPI000649136F|nr:hypothetical protein [Psychroserpens sp. Hel_I_66]
MAKTKLHDYYISLIPNLVTGLLFYIPKTELPLEVIDELMKLANHDFFNQVFAFDEYRGPVEYNSKSSKKGLFSISANLEKKIFGLLEKKGEVSETEFKYLLEKYRFLVETLFSYSQWMNDNLGKLHQDNENLENLFRYQFSVYRKHLETVFSTFYDSRSVPSSQYFDSKKIIDEFFPDLAKSFSKDTVSGLLNTQKLTVAKMDSPKQSSTVHQSMPPQEPKQKKSILSEEEAKKVLLKTYFGID